MEHTPTKSEKSGALLYISKELNHKNRKDLNINKNEMLESVFIEVLSKSNKNTIIGLYTNTQNLHFYTTKMIINQIRKFLNHMYASSLFPQIIIPTRISPRSKTLIDNIFTNFADESSITGNLSYSISDHLAQFLIYSEFKAKNHRKQETIYKRNYSKNNLSNLKNEPQNIDWLDVLKANY